LEGLDWPLVTGYVMVSGRGPAALVAIKRHQLRRGHRLRPDPARHPPAPQAVVTWSRALRRSRSVESVT
jgi:hypothetical protein